MTTPMLMTEHPTEQLLAEFIDDKLDTAALPAVTDHLASCGECREIVLLAHDYQVSEEPANVTRGTFGKQPWLPALGLAAAAAIAIVVVQPSWLFGPKLDDLVAAARTETERPSDGRLAGGFAFSKQPSTMRGAQEGDFGNVELLTLADKLQNRDDSHLRGLSLLLIAKTPQDVEEAVKQLNAAYEAASGEKRDAIAIDLAAALFAHARRSNDRDQDYARALALSNDVLKRQPQSAEALWNRAVALDAISLQEYESPQKKADAIRAWDDYRKVDSSSEWAQEARQRKSRLQSDY